MVNSSTFDILTAVLLT